jgi:flagellar biosynthesis/type III secretory pathway M-ring protein FliF/YscJ
MGQAAETVTVVFAAIFVAAMAFEVDRRRKHLRKLYDVLDSDERRITSELEAMVQNGTIKPYTDEIFAW